MFLGGSVIRMVRIRSAVPWTFYSKMTAFGPRLFFDFTNDTPTFSIEHETGDLAIVQRKLARADDTASRFIKDVRS